MRKFFYNLAIVVLALVFCVSGYMVFSYYWEGNRQAETFDQLSQAVQQAQQEAATAPTQAEEPTEPQMLPGYRELYQQNNDLVGWLRIEDTRVDYPVMQTPDRVDYYLKRDFNGEYSDRGCLYVREACDVFAPSDNVTIYGHAMGDGSMFWGLQDYVVRDFWKEHPTVCFDTLYDQWEYQIFAVFRTSAQLGKGFAYHLMDDAQDAQEFDEFVAQCKKLSIYDTGITPEYGDKLLCLSTCEYTLEDGRLVVAAVRVHQE